MHHLEQQLRREQACIDAIHRSRTRIPLANLFRRRPWRSPGGIRGAVDGMRDRPFRVAVRNGWEWLSKAHDCSDPVVACSCSGGFRFPLTAAAHDDLCEAEYVFEAPGWTSCGCSDRADAEHLR